MYIYEIERNRCRNLKGKKLGEQLISQFFTSTVQKKEKESLFLFSFFFQKQSQT